MAINWGSFENHLRAGIAHSISPANPSHSDTTVTVTWKYYVGTDGWDWNDGQTLTTNAEGLSQQNTNYHNGLTSGSKLVRTRQKTYSINFSNSGSASASCSVSGAWNGATPSKSVNVNLPERPPAPPDKITDQHTQGTDHNSTTIDWTAPDNNGEVQDKYDVEVDNNAGFGSPVLNDNNVTTSQRFVGGLNSGTTYYYRIRAHNSAGWGPFSNTRSFTTDSQGPSVPGTPSQLNRTDTTIKVGWSASFDNGGSNLAYEVQCATDAAFTTVVSTFNGTATVNQFTGLTAGTTHYFRGRASTDQGTSGWSDTRIISTLTVPNYNDPGPYANQVNAGFEAVAEKLVHLGAYLYRGRTSGTQLINSTPTAIQMGGLISSQGPDAPTYSSPNFVIQYPGLYLIEFMFRWDDSGNTGNNVQEILVNGSSEDLSNNVKTGYLERIPANAGGGGNTGRKIVHTVPLVPNDTVGFRVEQFSGGTMTQPNPLSPSDLYTWAKVTMIGF